MMPDEYFDCLIPCSSGLSNVTETILLFPKDSIKSTTALDGVLDHSFQMGVTM
jgi:hypothetical protein